jgi:HSP20 family protein
MPLFEPLEPLFELSRELDRRLNPASSFVPAADVVVTDDDVTVVMDVPGIKGDDLAIELQDDVLTVRGERPMASASREESAEGRVWQRLERGYGSFERVLRLPQGMDAERISASMADGVLTLRIPKPEARKPRRIQIATGGEADTIDGTSSENRELAGSPAG